MSHKAVYSFYNNNCGWETTKRFPIYQLIFSEASHVLIVVSFGIICSRGDADGIYYDVAMQHKLHLGEVVFGNGHQGTWCITVSW